MTPIQDINVPPVSAVFYEKIAEKELITSGEVRTTSFTGGQKGQKPQRMDLLPWEALMELSEHYAKGAAKYSDSNWRRGYNWSLSIGALFRHAAAFAAGEDIDEETGSSHMAGVAFHALTLMTFYHDHKDFDDRYKGEEE